MHRRETSSIVAEEEQTGWSLKTRALDPEIKSLKKMLFGKGKPGSAARSYWAAMELDCLVPSMCLLPLHLLVFSSSLFPSP